MEDLSYNWADDAECAGTADPDQFEMQKGESHQTPRIRMLVANYCGRCSVALECLEEAINLGDKHSLRGGLTPGQRKNIIKFPN